MTYKFTSSAENVIEYANKITLKLGHDYIGTEHILYGLAKENTGIANKVLESQGITAQGILNQIEDIIGSRKNKRKKDSRLYTKNEESIRKCIRRGKKIWLWLYRHRTYINWNYKRRG